MPYIYITPHTKPDLLRIRCFGGHLTPENRARVLASTKQGYFNRFIPQRKLEGFLLKLVLWGIAYKCPHLKMFWAPEDFKGWDVAEEKHTPRKTGPIRLFPVQKPRPPKKDRSLTAQDPGREVKLTPYANNAELLVAHDGAGLRQEDLWAYRTLTGVDPRFAGRILPTSNLAEYVLRLVERGVRIRVTRDLTLDIAALCDKAREARIKSGGVYGGWAIPFKEKR